MSGVLLTASTSTQLLTAEPDTTIPTALLPGPVTSKREFTRNDTLCSCRGVPANGLAQKRNSIDISDDARRGVGTREVISRSTQEIGADPRGKSKNSSATYSTTIPSRGQSRRGDTY